MFVYTSGDIVTAILLCAALFAILLGAVVGLTAKLLGLIRQMRPWAGR